MDLQISSFLFTTEPGLYTRPSFPTSVNQQQSQVNHSSGANNHHANQHLVNSHHLSQHVSNSHQANQQLSTHQKPYANQATVSDNKLSLQTNHASASNASNGKLNNLIT